MAKDETEGIIAKEHGLERPVVAPSFQNLSSDELEVVIQALCMHRGQRPDYENVTVTQRLLLGALLTREGKVRQRGRELVDRWFAATEDPEP